MPFLDYVLFGNSKDVKIILNIGGISNVTVIGRNVMPIAFDIGPGNGLIDLICNLHFKKDFDFNGTIAKKGKIDFNAVKKALKDPYFKQKPPKSTGKEYFNLSFIRKYLSQIKKPEDKIATLTYFTAKTIEKAFVDFVFPKYKVKELIISGGGLKNKVLIDHLEALLPSLKFTTSDKYGLPYKYKEAILFALLGFTCHLKKSNNIPSCTGAMNKIILGKIIKV
jgi:anhydro-N-acetylmuramic acid kinase